MSTPKPPTLRQLEILRAIEGYRRSHGFAPSIREIGELAGIGSTNGVADHLRALQRKGLLARERMTARSYHATTRGLLELATGGAR